MDTAFAPSDASFTVTNSIGQVLYTQRESNLSTSYIKSLDFGYLPNGLYLIEVMVGDERYVKQVVKQSE